MCNNVAVMRRRSDSWLNATQILKVANFDKPQRTRILEREVQKGEHEKVQGGYGKYQGTARSHRTSENVGLTYCLGCQGPGFLWSEASPSVNSITATNNFARSSNLIPTPKALHPPPNMSPPLLRSKSAVRNSSHNQNLPHPDAPPVPLVNNNTKNPTSRRSRTGALWTGRYRPRRRTLPPPAPERPPRSTPMQTTIPGTYHLTHLGRGGENLGASIMVAHHPRIRVAPRDTQTKS